jgi:stage V sporulation protein B
VLLLVGPLEGFRLAHLPFMILSLLLGMFLTLSVEALVGLTAFWTKDNAAVWWVVQKLAFMLGLFLPQGSEATVALIVAGMTICELFSTFMLLFLYRRRRREGGGEGQAVPPPLLRRKVAAVAVPIGITSLPGNLMGSVNAVMIPQRLVQAGMEVSAAMSAFGVLFGMAIPMMTLPTAFIGAFSIILIPKLTESLTLGRTKEIRHMVSRALLGTSALAMPSMTLLYILGPTFGEFLFHEPSVGVLLNCFRAILGSMLNGLGREATSAASGLVSELIHLGFAWVGTGMPGVGLYGFLLGLCVSGLFGAVWNGIALCRETGIRPGFPKWFFSPALAALFSGLCTQLLFRAGLGGGLPAIFAALLALFPGCLFYCVALSAQGISLRNLLRMK